MWQEVACGDLRESRVNNVPFRNKYINLNPYDESHTRSEDEPTRVADVWAARDL